MTRSYELSGNCLHLLEGFAPCFLPYPTGAVLVVECTGAVLVVGDLDTGSVGAVSYDCLFSWHISHYCSASLFKNVHAPQLHFYSELE